jgi:single-strand DNA-binding protein
VSDVNVSMMIGRVVRDAETKIVPSGVTLASFSIAVSYRHGHGDQMVEETSFFDIELWGRGAEALAQYIKKGKQLAVVGRNKQQRWETPEGEKRSRVVVVANTIELLGGNPRDSSEEPRSSAPARPAAPSTTPKPSFSDAVRNIENLFGGRDEAEF